MHVQRHAERGAHRHLITGAERGKPWVTRRCALVAGEIGEIHGRRAYAQSPARGQAARARSHRPHNPPPRLQPRLAGRDLTDRRLRAGVPGGQTPRPKMKAGISPPGSWMLHFTSLHFISLQPSELRRHTRRPKGSGPRRCAPLAQRSRTASRTRSPRGLANSSRTVSAIR